jgi:folate-binding protein YgfZ
MAVGEPALDDKYRALHEEAGFLVRRGRGQIEVNGSDGAEFLQGQVTNDVEALGPGEGCYAALLDPKGHMKADLRVLCVALETLWLDTEPAGAPALWRHLNTYKIGRRVEVVDRADERAIVSVIGPEATRATGSPPLHGEHEHAEFEYGTVSCRAVRTDLGVDLIVPMTELAEVRERLTAADVPEVDETAAEICRIEAGRPRYGLDMTTATIPQEAGINDRAVSFTKGCYIGQETVARLFYKGKPNRHLRGLKLDRPVEAGASLRLGDREVGSVGSSCLSPKLGPIALALVRREAQPGDALKVGDQDAHAEVVELPFVG